MNNTTFGTDAWTYYETIGGGQGASPGADGPAGGARRDVERAQHARRGARARVPATRRALRAAPRLGRRRPHRGGDGVVRELRALEPCRLSVLGDRRRHAPAGARGGEPGARGRTLVNGEEIPGKDTRALRAGRRRADETPGGGGYGRGG